MSPYVHFTIDIETANAEPTEAERWCRMNWSPSPKWKPETIGERYLEMLAKKKERLALLDQSPVICISIKTEQDLRCLHAMRAQEPTPMGGGLVEGFGSERDMLCALRNLLDHPWSDEGTVLVGHNIRKFDLPKLRTAFVRNHLKLPFVLTNHEQPCHDNMREFGDGFSLDNDLFISAADLAESLGLPHHKGLMSGAEIPELYAAGNYERIIAYAMADVMLEYDTFLRMTGLAQDEPLPAVVRDADDPFRAEPAEKAEGAERNGNLAAAQETLQADNQMELFFRVVIEKAADRSALEAVKTSLDLARDGLGQAYPRILEIWNGRCMELAKPVPATRTRPQF